MDKALGKKGNKAGGGKNSILNGRALFQFNPELFKDNEDGGAEQSKGSAAEKAPALAKAEEEKVADDGQITEKPQIDESLFQGEDAGDEDVDFD